MLSRLWLSGYRAWELGVHGDEDPKLKVIKYLLKDRLTAYLEDGLDWLITGGELGVEQWGAEVALDLQPTYPNLQIAVMLPFTDFGHQWNDDNQAKLHSLQKRVTFTSATSQAPYSRPAQLSGYNRFMAKHTDGALFLYDTDYPGKTQYGYQAALAEGGRRDYPVTTITVDDLDDAARDLAENDE
ncbi:SLOG family protein [Lacticaseibacillus sp. GG6-2]